MQLIGVSIADRNGSYTALVLKIDTDRALLDNATQRQTRLNGMSFAHFTVDDFFVSYGYKPGTCTLHQLTNLSSTMQPLCDLLTKFRLISCPIQQDILSSSDTEKEAYL